jgi:hypothetical protein
MNARRLSSTYLQATKYRNVVLNVELSTSLRSNFSEIEQSDKSRKQIIIIQNQNINYPISLNSRIFVLLHLQSQQNPR